MGVLWGIVVVVNYNFARKLPFGYPNYATLSKSELKVYRCKDCQSIYNLYTGTVFQQRHVRPQQAILLIRGVLKGEPSDVLARELELNYVTVLQLRRKLQDNTQLLQSEDPVPDFEAESDEMFQNAGEKRR